MNSITIPNISIPTIGIPTIGIPSVGFPSASGGGGLSWPAGMKEHIKAWYDPKKQGMTNYDVIEAYTEDFTTWTVNKEGVIANVTSKSITITNVLNSNPLIYAYDTFSVRLRIDGLKNGQGIFFGDNKEYTISENGIYDIDTTENIRTNFIGECNITITQLPTSILKDFSGNGNHAYLYGGKGKLNSGMGVYQQDFSNVRGVTTVSANGFELFREGTGGTYLARISIGYWNNKECKLLFETNNTSNLYYIRYRKANNDIVTSVRLHNGENIIPAQDDLTDVSEVIFEGALRDNEYIRVIEIPDYPDQLCYDGKMYAVAYDMPILTDYTVMAERTWFEKEEYSAFISNSLGGMEDPDNGAFSVEIKSLNSFTTISFGSITSIGIPEKGITYQTKQSYNGNSINVGTKESNDILILGGRYFYKNDNAVGNTWTGCHGAIIVADRSFTEEEINWLKQNWDKI